MSDTSASPAGAPKHQPTPESRYSDRRTVDRSGYVLAAAILVAAYLVSFGPIAAYYEEHPFEKGVWHHTTAHFIYKPLELTINFIPALERPVETYIHFWTKIINPKRSPFTDGRIEVFSDGFVVG